MLPTKYVPKNHRKCCVCSIYYQPNPSRRGGPCHGPQGSAFSGLPVWSIPSTESGPQPLLVTYNLSSLALTSGEPTPYVCMYVSMVCGMYVGMCWVRRESTQVHREGGTVSSKGKKCSVCDHDGASSQGAVEVLWKHSSCLTCQRRTFRGPDLEILGIGS